MSISVEIAEETLTISRNAINYRGISVMKDLFEKIVMKTLSTTSTNFK